MEESAPDAMLERVAREVQAKWASVDEDRRLFFEALVALQGAEDDADVVKAAQLFRSAARQCSEPFSFMARLGQGRCEALRGREGVALKIFKTFTAGEGPRELRRLAWMEIADLGRRRENKELVARAMLESRALGD